MKPHPETQKPVGKLSLVQSVPSKRGDEQDVACAMSWMPLILACVLEIVWIVAPWGSALGFFCLLSCIILAGVSLIVGIITLVKWEHPYRAAGILVGTVVLLPFIAILLLEVLKLNVYLH